MNFRERDKREQELDEEIGSHLRMAEATALRAVKRQTKPITPRIAKWAT